MNSRTRRNRFLIHYHLLLTGLPGVVLLLAGGGTELLLTLFGVPFAAPGCSAVTGRRSQPPSCVSSAAADISDGSRIIRDREFIGVPFVSNGVLLQCRAVAVRLRGAHRIAASEVLNSVKG